MTTDETNVASGYTVISWPPSRQLALPGCLAGLEFEAASQPKFRAGRCPTLA